jgi:hypothetical protein
MTSALWAMLARLVTCDVRRTISDPLAAGFSITLCRYGLENILDIWPRFLVAARHDGGAISSTLLASGNTGPNESETLLSKVSSTAIGVREVGISAINNDVSWLGSTFW